MRFDIETGTLVGKRGSLKFAPDDELGRKLAMLIESECEGLGVSEAAEKYGYSRQRYNQIRSEFGKSGTKGLVSRSTGPKRNHRRTDEVIRQVIRHRFLDPQASCDVIAQKIRQSQMPISTRSVDRIMAEYGLQKKAFIGASRAAKSRPVPPPLK